MSPAFYFAPNEPVAELRIVNPKKRNAITHAMWRSLPAMLADLNVRALLIRGEGGHFCAGADLVEFQEFPTNPQIARNYVNDMCEALDALRTLSIPTIAHVRGACYGAGAAIAMACDIRIAEDTARFSIPPAKLGLIYPQADIDRLVQLVGPGQAARLLFTGDVIDTSLAMKIGLIEQAGALDTALSIGHSISMNAPTAISTLKQQIRGTLPDDRSAFLEAFSGEEFAEGLNAFANKRTPDYS